MPASSRLSPLLTLSPKHLVWGTPLTLRTGPYSLVFSRNTITDTPGVCASSTGTHCSIQPCIQSKLTDTGEISDRDMSNSKQARTDFGEVSK